jgi:hypothetical protein
MSVRYRNFSIAIFVLLASVIAVGVVPVHATAVPPKCMLVFQTGTKTGIAPGTTGVELTYELIYPTYYPSPAPIAASFVPSATSSNPAWTVASVGPSLVEYFSSPSTSFTYYPITVFVNAASASGSTTTLNVTATAQQAGVGSCFLLTVLTTSGTPPSTVPEFPLGMLALLGLALPAIVLLKRKFSVATPV